MSNKKLVVYGLFIPLLVTKPADSIDYRCSLTFRYIHPVDRVDLNAAPDGSVLPTEPKPPGSDFHARLETRDQRAPVDRGQGSHGPGKVLLSVVK